MDVVETQTNEVELDGAMAPAPGSAHLHTLFRGRGEYSIDDKGRLTVPPHMRKALAGGGNLVVVEGRAVIWNEAGYLAATEELRRQVDDPDSPVELVHVRGFASNTHPVSPDAQGRIVVPHPVRIEAGLERDVVVLGAGPRIEIVPAGSDSLDNLLGVADSVGDALDRAHL